MTINDAAQLPPSRIEMKLKRGSAPKAREFKALRVQLHGLLELADFEIERQGCQTILDEYIDCPKLRLYWNNSSLRVRHLDGNKELTLKKLKHQPQLGCFESAEHREPIARKAYKALLRNDMRGVAQIVRDTFGTMPGRLQVVLRVRTRRRVYLLHRGSEHYRLVLDTFRCVGSGFRRSKRLCELVIEAQSPEAKERLGDLQAKLIRVLGLHGFSAASMLKYRHGIRLLGLDMGERFKFRLTLSQWVAIIGIAVTVISIVQGILSLMVAK